MKNWAKYLELVAERPELFVDGDLTIVFDEKEIAKFEQSSGREIGVVYESPWRYMLVDLVRNKAGKLFPYERVVPVKQGGVAVLPVYQGQVVLIHEFRHAPRELRWEIPRGFGEVGVAASLNAKKELREETGIEKATITYLGAMSPDSGLTADRVDLFLAEVQELNCSLSGQDDTEAINAVALFSLDQIRTMAASGELTDAFALSAIGLWQLGQPQD